MNLTAQQLYRIRRTHGLTVEQMAEILDCSQGYVSGIERGDFRITANIQNKAASAFELTPNKMRSITMFYDQYIKPHEKKEGK